MIRNGDVESIPLMIGVTSQEGAWLMAAFYGQDNKTLLKSFQNNLKTAMSAMTAHFFSEEVRLKVLNQCRQVKHAYAPFLLLRTNFSIPKNIGTDGKI
jgi:hypothetical protein